MGCKIKNQNMSDLIESYLKNVLHKNETAEIRRARLQTNSIVFLPKLLRLIPLYASNKGMLLKVKRVGGYIRIINLVDEMDVLNALGDLVPEELL